MGERKTILSVGHNRKNLELLAQVLEKEGYATVSAASQEEFSAFAYGNNRIDLALIDLGGFDKRIWETCEHLREREIPFFVISSKMDEALRRESVARNACGLLVKPLIVKDLLALIRQLLGG